MKTELETPVLGCIARRKDNGLPIGTVTAIFDETNEVFIHTFDDQGEVTACGEQPTDDCTYHMPYYQPELTEQQMLQTDFYSFQVYHKRENAVRDYPNAVIKEYSADDIEEPMFVDEPNSFM